MSKWIDAEWLLNFFEPYPNDYQTPLGLLRACVDDAPSIDKVTCSECKYWRGDGVFTLNALGEEEQLCKWWSKFGTIRTAETDFCSYGEREGE